MSEVVVRVEGLSKQYTIGRQVNRYGRLTEALWEGMAARLRRDGRGPQEKEPGGEFWALDDVSLEVSEGEVLGIVGRNGAGKTTLLKVLSRITEPTRGRAELHGRVGALLEVGTGFHPELTGRENILLNGGILGMRRGEIRAKFDEIVEFAEVQRFIDTPVKRYSSGMYVRLAFAVAAHLEPEILIIDEVLAVGDVAFQKKCLGKMNDVAREGRTVLFVSHNAGAVAELCTRAVLLERGRKVADGPVSEVLARYSAQLASGAGGRMALERDPSLPASVIRVGVDGPDDRDQPTFDITDEVTLSIAYEVRERVHGLQVVATLARNAVTIFQTFDTDELDEIPVREPGVYEARYSLPAMFLKAGLYTLDIHVGTQERLLQTLEAVASFEVEELSVNTHAKGYRRDRLGHVIAPGGWRTERVGAVEAAPAERA